MLNTVLPMRQRAILAPAATQPKPTYGNAVATPEPPYPVIPVPQERAQQITNFAPRLASLYPDYLNLDEHHKHYTSTHLDCSPERLALRNSIAKEMYGEGAKQHDRRIDIIMGNMATGKSYLANEIIKEKGSLLIDQDEINKHLPEFHTNQAVGVKINSNIKALTTNNLVEESWGIAKDILSQAVKNEDNIVLPYWGGNLNEELEMVQYLKKHNYRIYYHFVDAPIRSSAERAFERFHQDGRYTNLSKMVARGNEAWQSWMALSIYATEAGLIKGCYFWDNSEPKHDPFKLQRVVGRSGLNVPDVAAGLNLVG
jgi:predicted kinase